MSEITENQFEEKLSAFVRELAPHSKTIKSTTKLFDDGIIDSLKILDLIAFVEVTLKIKVPDSKVVIENFRTIKDISDTFWKEKSSYAKK